MSEERIFLKRYELEQHSLKKEYREMLREASESERSELKRELDDLFNEERPYDKIRLGLPGWKSRFHREYFGVETCNEIGKLQNDMAEKYLEGLCWVFQCYFADVPSWSWYYPFYVAPFVSDLKGLSRFQISFTLDKPLRPFDQLMAVLPTMDEVRRNITRQDKVFLHRNSNALAHIKEVVVQTSYCSAQKLPIDSATSGIGGWLSPDDNDGLSNSFFPSPIKNLQDITNDQAISARFFNPEVGDPITRLLSGVRVPEKTVSGADISKRPLWHSYSGSRPPRYIKKRPPPPIVQRPDSIWKPSTPVTPREEHKNAGTGWMGRGRGNNAIAAGQTQLPCRNSSYGHGTASDTPRSSSSYNCSYWKSFHRVDMPQSRGSDTRFDNDGGGAPWTGGGGGHGASAQQRRW